MKQCKITVDKEFKTGEVDKRIFGSFLEHLGRAVYGGVYQPGSRFADEQGFRRDTIELVKKIDVPITRYPGGNFVSAYNWEDSVGPKERRPRRADVAWTTIENNQFGLNEFMDWCKKAGTEPMIAVNLGTRGLDAARNLLEYCNFPGGTYYSDLRKEHGYEEPHNVKVWCLGNEMDGPWQIGHKKPGEYGQLAAQTARLMKALDPRLEFVACGSSTHSMSSFATWEMEALDECYEDVDYLSMHAYYGKFNGSSEDLLASSVDMERFIKEVVSICDCIKAKKRSNKKMYISFDEWNINYHYRMSQSDPEKWKQAFEKAGCFEDISKEVDSNLPKNPPYRWEEAPHRLEDVYTLEDAVAFGGLIIALLKNADRVKIACLAQLVNVIAPILTSDTGAWVNTIFWPYMQASVNGRGTVLQTIVKSSGYENKLYGYVEYVDAVVIEKEKEEEVVIFAINRDLEEDYSLCCDLRQYDQYEVKEHYVLNHDNILAFNSETNPNEVKPKLKLDTRMEDGILNGVLEKHSWNMIRMGKRQ